MIVNLLQFICQAIVNRLQRWLSDIEKRRAEAVLGARRSPCWYALTRKMDKEGKRVCAITGDTKDVEYHHKRPFHLYPEDECKEENTIALRRDMHFLFGHRLNWSSHEIDVERLAKEWKERIKNRP